MYVNDFGMPEVGDENRAKMFYSHMISKRSLMK